MWWWQNRKRMRMQMWSGNCNRILIWRRRAPGTRRVTRTGLPCRAATAIAVLEGSSQSVVGSQSRTVLRKTLLTVEIAATAVLLIAAGTAERICGWLRPVGKGSHHRDGDDAMIESASSDRGTAHVTPQAVKAIHGRSFRLLAF